MHERCLLDLACHRGRRLSSSSEPWQSILKVCRKNSLAATSPCKLRKLPKCSAVQVSAGRQPFSPATSLREVAGPLNALSQTHAALPDGTGNVRTSRTGRLSPPTSLGRFTWPRPIPPARCARLLLADLVAQDVGRRRPTHRKGRPRRERTYPRPRASRRCETAELAVRKLLSCCCHRLWLRMNKRSPPRPHNSARRAAPTSSLRIQSVVLHA